MGVRTCGSTACLTLSMIDQLTTTLVGSFTGLPYGMEKELHSRTPGAEGANHLETYCVACRWDSRMSAVTPDEDVFYLVAFLQSVVPSMGPNLETLLDRNSALWKYCAMLGCKQYLPKYSTLADWQAHFGAKWNDFVRNKIKFDPKAVLSPSQGIFARGEDIPVPLSYR